MTVNRGDIVSARFPHTAGTRGKKRPVLVVQSDAYHSKMLHVVVAEITTNLDNMGDPAFLHIDILTPEGQATGLRQSSLASFLHLATVNTDRITRVIGKLSGALIQQMNDGLVTALGLP